MKQSVAYYYLLWKMKKMRIYLKEKFSCRKRRRSRYRKNIVGVVLQCNNFDVIDLGVMVLAKK